MWVKLIETQDVVKQELEENSHKVQATIGDSPDNIADFFSNAYSFISVKTPLLLSSFKTFISDAGDLKVAIYKYNALGREELVFMKETTHANNGAVTIECNVFLSAGKYVLHLTNNKIGVKYPGQPLTKHMFFAVLGGTKMDNNFPSWLEGYDDQICYGLYEIAIEVANKSLYLGITNELFLDEQLIQGAYYYLIKNGNLITQVFDGTHQYALS